MSTCDKCNAPVSYSVTRRLNLFRVKPRYLCEVHKRRLELADDFILMLALIASVAIFVLSLRHDQIEKMKRTMAEEQIALQQFQAMDLDGNGRISLFEEQTTNQERENLRKTGYPFSRLIEEAELSNDKVLRKLIVPTFLESIRGLDEDDLPLISHFRHDLLMEKFLRTYTAEDCSPCLRHIYLTNNRFLALALVWPETTKLAIICMEKIDIPLAKALLAMPEPKTDKK